MNRLGLLVLVVLLALAPACGRYRDDVGSPTDIEIAVGGGEESVREFLQADPSQSDLDDILFAAVATQDLDSVRLIVNAGGNPAAEREAFDRFLWSRLARGSDDRVDLAEYLVAQGGDPCQVSAQLSNAGLTYARIAKNAGQPALALWFETVSKSCS